MSTTDKLPSRKESADQLAEIAASVTPAIDALATAVHGLGGVMCVAVEVDGHLFKRRSLRSRFDVSLRDPDDGAAAEQELAPAGAMKALSTAYQALRSYQHGNSAADLAKGVADHLAVLLGEARAAQ